ncbi:MAG: molybdopterin biosynthesis protein [Thermoprotei archaeon]|nr:MAG: molybdopterin biosynthesis protein [Thermoprotei archaeon]
MVMEEYTSRRDGRVLIYRSVAPGENIAFTGSDISFGDLVLQRGTRLGPPELGLLAGLGISRVKVYRRVRVAVFSTGNEVVRPGSALKPGAVYDANSSFILASLRELGAYAVYAGHLPDDYDYMYRRVSEALRRFDVVMTSGGTSAGEKDLVYRVFNDLGEPGVVVHGVKMKPGRPTVIAVVNGKLFIGLPGFPLSCAMSFLTVVRPIIAKLVGLRDEEKRSVRARFAYRLRTGRGRAWLIPVSLVTTDRGLVAYPVTMSSGDISPLVRAEGYTYIPEGKEVVEEGEEIEVVLFGYGVKIPEVVIIGSHDVALHRLLSLAGLAGSSKVIPVGSLRGLYAAGRGEADIAPTHLLDEESGEYNTPFLDRLGLRGKLRLVRGYARRIGLIVAPGNPKGIRGLRDIVEKDVVFVNRNKGSGTRTFTDIMFRRAAEELGMSFKDAVSRVRGYSYEVKTHTAVAAAVAHGRADVGVGIEYVARAYKLEFIPLAEEVLDFAIPRDRLGKKGVGEFIKTLRSDEFRKVLESMPGYRVLSSTGEVIA